MLCHVLDFGANQQRVELDFDADDSGAQVHQVVPSDDPHDALLDALLLFASGPTYIPIGDALSLGEARCG